MKVMQLIDSLELGGAERMAVSYANMLSQEIETSYLCSTRVEGPLKESILPKVRYYCLNRKHTLDMRAIKKLVALVKKENIDIIHAHGTSYFFACLVKAWNRPVKLIWHNHYGASANHGWIKRAVMKKCMSHFDAIVTVNDMLKKWVFTSLKFPEARTFYVSNFVDFKSIEDGNIALKGVKSQRIVCLANLKHPKEHLLLCQSFEKIIEQFPKASLHLVGADYQDTYSADIRKYIKKNSLEQKIVIHGKQARSQAYLDACAIGVIASSSEGLPMALLEYGRSKLAVIATNVGQCKAVVQDKGIIISSGDTIALSNALRHLLKYQEERTNLAQRYFKHIQTQYSLEAVKLDILNIYNAIHG